MAAVVVASDQERVVAKSVREMVRRGQYRTHMSSERPGARRRILDKFCAMEVSGKIAWARYDGGDDQHAREHCLRTLACALSADGVRMMILDTRGEEQNRRDRRLLRRLHQIEAIDQELRYEHRGSRDELLLCLPDAFAWAYGAGGAWRRQVEPLVEVLNAG